jgi:two-component system OmpR family response regulator
MSWINPVPSAGILLIGEPGADCGRLRTLMEGAGHTVAERQPAQDGSSASPQAAQLIIALPETAQEEVLRLSRDLASRGTASLLVLTRSGDFLERVILLEAGADDVLQWPAEDRVLLARITSVLRRRRGGALSRTALLENWRLDPISRTLQSPRGARMGLTAGELAIMSLFLSHPGVTFSTEVAGRMLGVEVGVAFRNAISRLRKKLEEIGEPDLIRTVRGQGYGCLL